MNEEKLSLFIGNSHMTIVDAMELIDKNSSGILFIEDADNKFVGCISDGDIRRWLIKTGDLQALVSDAMTKTPVSVYIEDQDKVFKIMQSKHITSIPILDVNHKIVDIALRTDFDQESSQSNKSSLTGVPVVVMAGGKGTRLYPYTKILPKPLVPIGDTPIVERIIKYYTEYGINEFHMTVNYKKEMIRSYFVNGVFPFTIKFVEETIPLGTGGSLKLIEDRFDRPLFVTNCDTLILADYDKIYDFHVKNGNVVTMVAAIKNITIPYGVLHTKESGELVGMEEKPRLSHMINTGMYVINPNVIDLIPEGCIFHMTHLVDKVRARGQKVGVYPVSEDSFLDMGEFDEMRRMEEKLNIVKD